MKISRLILTTCLVVMLFHAAVYAQAPQGCACCNEKAKQFHFWLGNWETFNPAGKLVGTNNIVLQQGGCVMQENWTSTGGPYTGTSYNFYNTATGKWNQQWIDNMGGSLQLEGEFNGTQMILKSKETKKRNGQLQIDRITWTPNPDGTVRQLWEASTDQEKTWTVAFDGLYKRKGG
ncbi:MAG: hypothetical protein JNK10_03885 [Cyclobacteriaceae bacterium]|nr:hypothetical protein [Cyclobacteriaceae bacterium]